MANKNKILKTVRVLLWIRLAVVISWIASYSGCLVAASVDPSSNIGWLWPCVSLLLFLFMLVYGIFVEPLLQRRLRCSSCSRSLARVLQGIRLRELKEFAFCPFCGARLDEGHEECAQPLPAGDSLKAAHQE